MNANRSLPTLSIVLTFALAGLACQPWSPASQHDDTGAAEDEEQIEDVGESVIGDLDWSDVQDLDEDSTKRQLAHYVGYLSFSTSGGSYGRCTASLVSPTLAVTNHHCVDDASNIRLNFDYLSEEDYDSFSDLRDESWVCDDVVLEEEDEDLALVHCDPDDNDDVVVGTELGGWIELPLHDEVAVEEDDEIYVLHQNCHYSSGSCGWDEDDSNGEATKKVSPGIVMEIPTDDYSFSSGARFEGDDGFEHSADTLGGTSGSLVFLASDHSPMGLHHGGSSAGNKARLLAAVIDNVPGLAEAIEDDIEEWSCTIDITYPSGGEELEIGTSYTIAWDSDCSENVQVHLYKDGSHYYTLAANDPNDGELEFTPISAFPEDDDYTACVSTVDDAVYACGDAFAIVAEDSGSETCEIGVEYPSGGEELEIGTSYTIAWDSDCSENVQVHLYKNGSHYYTLAANDPNDGELEFTPVSDFAEDDDYAVCVSTVDDAVYDCGDAFAIVAEDSGSETDLDGDGLADGTVDKLVFDGATMCWHQDLIGWTGTVWIVGYGFGGANDWTDLNHPATADGDFSCYDFEDGLYRVNAWDGSSSGAYTSWAYLDAYCGAYNDPVCWANSDASGYSVCFLVSGGEIEEASTTLCQGTE